MPNDDGVVGGQGLLDEESKDSLPLRHTHDSCGILERFERVVRHLSVR